MQQTIKLDAKMDNDITANCDCGAIQFKTDENPILQLCCHCEDCRDATGNDFSNIVFFKEKFVTVTGNPIARHYLAESQNKTARESCLNCKCVMFDKSNGFAGLIGVFTQRLNQPFESHTDCHVWVNSKVSGTTISKDVTQYKKGITSNSATK